MTIRQEVPGFRSGRSELAGLVRDISYEVMPLVNTEESVLRNVPSVVPLTVTVTEAKGIDATLELTERLARHGYTVAPHLPARQFVDSRHVGDVLARLRAAGIRSAFVIGGDAAEPAGNLPDAYSLLHAMTEIGSPFEEVGIGGYPEGHVSVGWESIDLALRRKAPMATHVVTQMCFDATTTASWAAGIVDSGVDLPVRVGVPGPVNRKKLMRISAGIGLGQSARFLRKQQNMLWRLLLPGGYSPTRLVRRLGAAMPDARGRVRGLHVFTFNELRKTEMWRQDLLDSVAETDIPA